MITVEKLDNQGRGIAYNKGKIMFINNALPGETVSVKNVKENKKFSVADVNRVSNKSTLRVKPKCPFYKSCGGCNIMHMGIENQEEFKLNKEIEILRKYAGLRNEVKLIKNDKQIFYRNKATLKIEDGEWGYYNNDTHDIVSINNCLLVDNSINEIIHHHDFLSVMSGEVVIRTNSDGEILIALKTRDKCVIEENKIPNNVVGIVVNDKTKYKDNYFYEKIDELKFKISYNSFFQTNNYMLSKIYEILRNNLSGNNLLDLYCGVGSLGMCLFNNFKKIVGIEIIENAVIDAKENALMNGITNANYYAGDSFKILSGLNEVFDTVIVDPPRSGLNKDTLKQLEVLKPKNIAYVSCDPITLARDLKTLIINYRINKINALDMFPNTHHVESIVILERK